MRNQPRHYQHRFIVNAPLSAVAAFHADSRALPQLTPPGMFMRVHELEPMGEGSIARFTMWLGPVPLHWTAVHSQVDPLRGFVDTQTAGPFASWRHEHRFEALSEGETAVVDSITAQLGEPLFWRAVTTFMWYTLPILFAYRQWQTKRQVRG